MRKVLMVVIVTAVLLTAGMCLAQALPDAPPAPGSSATTHFTVSGSAVGFSGGGSSSAATIAGGTVQLTNRFALGYEQVIVPSVSGTYYIGTANYTMPMTALIGKTLNSKMVFDTTKWSTTFFAGAGVFRQTDPAGTQQQHIATTLGAGLNYDAGSHVVLQVISAQWLHAAVVGPGANTFVVTPNTSAIASGLQLKF